MKYMLQTLRHCTFTTTTETNISQTLTSLSFIILILLSNPQPIRTAAIGPGCVKTQKRPHIVRSKLDRVSDEASLHWKGVNGSKASQMSDSLYLIFTSTIACF